MGCNKWKKKRETDERQKIVRAPWLLFSIPTLSDVNEANYPGRLQGHINLSEWKLSSVIKEVICEERVGVGYRNQHSLSPSNPTDPKHLPQVGTQTGIHYSWWNKQSLTSDFISAPLSSNRVVKNGNWGFTNFACDRESRDWNSPPHHVTNPPRRERYDLN